MFCNIVYKQVTSQLAYASNVIVDPRSPPTTVYVGDVYIPVADVKQSAYTNANLLLCVYKFPLLSLPLQATLSSISTYIVSPSYKVQVPLAVVELDISTVEFMYIYICASAPPVSLKVQDNVASAAGQGVGDGVTVTLGVTVTEGVGPGHAEQPPPYIIAVFVWKV